MPKPTSWFDPSLCNLCEAMRVLITRCIYKVKPTVFLFSLGAHNTSGLDAAFRIFHNAHHFACLGGCRSSGRPLR